MNFLTHRWVRGEHFWGRTQVLELLKRRLNKFTWILGNRRVGKTSLLRQIEHLCRLEDWGYTPLYLDFQGAGDEDGLKMAFLEAFDEQEDCAKALDLDLDDLESRTLSSFLYHIKRNLKRSDLNILFLIDEAEELVDISQTSPQVLSILRKFFHGDNKISVFLTSSYVLHEVTEPSRTSQFIQEFLPPVPLFPFSEEETLAFLDSKGISGFEAESIYTTSMGNPYLVQNLGDKTLEKGFDAAFEELLNSKFFKYFFESNFNCLPLALREEMSGHNPWDFFKSLTPASEVLQYLIQSCLFSKKPASDRPTQHVINPLLEQVFKAQNLLKPQKKQKKMDVFFELAESLCSRETPLSALQFSGDFPGKGDLTDAKEPPTRELLELSDEKTLFQTLLWATPEYITGQAPDERSSVYLAGLLLASLLFEGNPLTQIQSLQDRISFLQSQPAFLNRNALIAKGIPSHLGMILLKAMAPRPELRYQSMDRLIDDIKKTTV